MQARGFEKIHRALDVYALVERRLGQAGPHPRPGRQVHHDGVRPDQVAQESKVGDVTLDQLEPGLADRAAQVSGAVLNAASEPAPTMREVGDALAAGPPNERTYLPWGSYWCTHDVP